MGNEETTKTGFAKNYPDGLNEIIGVGGAVILSHRPGSGRH